MLWRINYPFLMVAGIHNLDPRPYLPHNTLIHTHKTRVGPCDSRHGQGFMILKYASYDTPMKASELLMQHHKEALEVMPDTTWVDDNGIRWMKRSIIFTLEAAFQPRTFEGQIGDRHSLIQDLIEAINRAGIERIDPIKVWWSGKAWFVVDGHHRLHAIDRVNSYRHKKGTTTIKDIPVMIIDGGISEACRTASRENGKAHLNMTAKQRSQWAWRVAVLHWAKVIPERFIMTEASLDLHVHHKTLSNMRAIFHQIRERFKAEHGRSPDPSKDAEWIHMVAGLQWPREAHERAKGTITEQDIRDDAWRAEAVMKTAEKLIRALGKEAFSSPGRAEITADALCAVSSRFIRLGIEAPDFREAIYDALKDEGWSLDEHGFRESEFEF